MGNHVMYDRGAWCSKGNHAKQIYMQTKLYLYVFV